ncbi:uncharacterized protein B0J16DRAFT_10067 [Fusarium flagelliforme]|uniref:Uncharacterized protein n=1 Tax=Fusarium flagelliforme TaxID=2675880 RepID=A0A395N7I9_9HYPO|nr:uncharacterized protein B0J16DRAFT_10067 [Fusarium flagelliforme]KAH7196978.1 hypothetical protein B0J16DRAFT_10067 [Fusarium flagelliforme]RFN55639.1 hypothetical protein FIE12Z_97 [Fusarium flagelliforme]
MSRRQNPDQRQYSQNYYTDSSRNWSEEAVRGSWDSNYQRTTSANTSPRDQSQQWSRPSPQAYDRRQTMVNQWLGQQYQHQYNHDPSAAADTVSDFTTPTTSPAFSDSPTFPSRTHDAPAYQTHAVAGDFLAPPSRTSVQYRQHDNQYHNGAASSSRGSTTYNQSADYRHMDYRSSDQDLRGVGSFADNDRSRREVKYKPLGNWFGLWLPPTE